MTKVINLQDFRNRIIEQDDESEDQEEGNILDEEEIAILIESTVASREEVSEEEIDSIIEWAKMVTFQNMLLDMILEGNFRIAWDFEEQTLCAWERDEE